jgi:hypothetical protein
VLAGSILPIWNIVENTLDRVAEHKRMKCVRVVLPGAGTELSTPFISQLLSNPCVIVLVTFHICRADEDAQEHIIGLQIDDKYIHTV